MALFPFIGGGKPQGGEAYPSDTLATRDGRILKFIFFKHASFAIEFEEKRIYVDPVSGYAEYARLPKADIVLVTHSHYDHLDRAAIDDITTRRSIIVCDRTSAEAFDADCITMTPDAVAEPRPYVRIEAVPAYNTTEGRTDFHPKSREDCGYILTVGGSRIYIAGDTEDTPEVLALRDIDAALLPVNQPYTMTVDQAVRAVKAIRPAVFYPYHYGEVEEKTDIERLRRELDGVTDVRVFPME